jgi:hypothetical protein
LLEEGGALVGLAFKRGVEELFHLLPALWVHKAVVSCQGSLVSDRERLLARSLRAIASQATGH